MFGDKLLPLDASQSLGRIFHVQGEKDAVPRSGVRDGRRVIRRSPRRGPGPRMPRMAGRGRFVGDGGIPRPKARLPGMRIAFLPALGEVEIGRAEVRLLRLRTDVPAAEPIGFGLVEEASDGLRQSA